MIVICLLYVIGVMFAFFEAIKVVNNIKELDKRSFEVNMQRLKVSGDYDPKELSVSHTLLMFITLLACICSFGAFIVFRHLNVHGFKSIYDASTQD